ncbi:MAG: hypothetical protein CVV59_01400 [Tenericutes bacterium HGW-Tenericutes-4]|nr:MAG: hypothetical protein CVV59_01400 [Tenericutes bacterium HGW-Tenericutes-4]
MKKNARTVSILLNVAIMFATVFAIITITYSWYNRNTNVTISTISMSVTESSGILLSGNALSWTPSLITDGGTNSININQTVSLNSISTSGQVVNANMKFYTGEFSGNSFNTILLTGSSLYYVFDVYVLNSDNVPKYFTLGKESSVVSVNDKGVELSIRSAFLNLGNANNALDAIDLDGTGVSSINYIWEPNSTTRHQNISSYQTSYVPEGKVSYNGVNMEATDLTLVNNLVVDVLGTPQQEAIEVITHDPIGAGDNDEITLLPASSITKLRVYIWCEGQDIDCVNSISAGRADLNFSFNSYDVQLVGQNYVAIEKFNTPTIINNSGANYTWSATTTNINAERFSSDYVVKISKYVESSLLAIRTIYTTETSINISNLKSLGLGNYYVEVKVYSHNYGNSNYSNTLSFTVLSAPTNFALIDSTTSWNTVSNAASYTIKVFDSSTGTTYTTTTTLLSLNLATTMFDGDIYLPTGKQYKVSIRANGNIGYASSDYTTTLNWLY